MSKMSSCVRLLFILSTVCGILITVCEGLYQVEVRVFGYDNPNGTCQACLNDDGEHGCCDRFATTSPCDNGLQCDSYFTYCLRPLGSGGEGCSDYESRESGVNQNDGSSRDALRGLENPLILSPGPVFTGGHGYTGVEICIEIQDRDTESPDERVDILLIDHSLPVGESTQRQTYDGMFGFVTMDLNITVFCVTGFTGADCLEVDDCVGVNCSGNGRCVDGADSFICNCSAGFTGELCQTNIDDCVEVSCSGNGQCVDVVDSFNCSCNVGFSGRLCDINIDDCSSNPCGVGGQCVDGIDNFTCSCDPGFTGEVCQIDIDDCVDDQSCSGNGRCVDGVNYFNCECSPGYTGATCNTQIEDPDARTDDASGAGNSGVIGGAVAGVLLVLVAVSILLVVIAVLALRHRKNHNKGTQPVKSQSHEQHDTALPGDNPVYELEEHNHTSFDSMEHTESTIPLHSSEERDFNNPIYGGDEDDSPAVYETPSDNLPDREFDNPIYSSGDAVDTTYSLLSDSTAAGVYDTVTDS